MAGLPYPETGLLNKILQVQKFNLANLDTLSFSFRLRPTYCSSSCSKSQPLLGPARADAAVESPASANKYRVGTWAEGFSTFFRCTLEGANPFAVTMVDVKEGFLCPICMKDLGDIPQLQLHFEEEHSKEDPLFLQNVKELFGKAKKKILSTAAVASTARSDDDRQQGFLSFSSMALTLGQDAKSGILGGGGGGRGESRTEVDAVSGVHISAVSRPSLRVVSHTGYFCQERKRRLERNKSTNQVRSVHREGDTEGPCLIRGPRHRF